MPFRRHSTWHPNTSRPLPASPAKAKGPTHSLRVHHKWPHSGPKGGQWASITQLLSEVPKLSPRRAHAGRALALPVPESSAMDLSSGDTHPARNTVYTEPAKNTEPAPALSLQPALGQGASYTDRRLVAREASRGHRARSANADKRSEGRAPRCPCSTPSGRRPCLVGCFPPISLVQRLSPREVK